MKIYLCTLLIALAIHTNAQLPKKFIPVVDQYFFSTPYQTRFGDWLQSIKTSDEVKIDSTFEVSDTTDVFLSAHLLTPLPAFPKTDSITLTIGNFNSITSKSVNGSIVQSDTMKLFYFREIFYFPKDSISLQNWKELASTTIKSLKKYFGVHYPRTPAYIKWKNIWFVNSDSNLPTIDMQYGQSQRRPDCYFIWLQLNFSLNYSPK